MSDPIDWINPSAKRQVEMAPQDLLTRFDNTLRRRKRFILFLALLLITLVCWSLTEGSADIALIDVLRAILSKTPFKGIRVENTVSSIIWEFRLPRILMGVLAGAGLGLVGCVMQAVLRNPLADPYMMGIASAAGFGASLAISFGAGFLVGKYLIVANAFLFSMGSSTLMMLLARRTASKPDGLILIGVSFVFIFSSATTFLQYFAEPEAVKVAMFWMAGDLGKASWENSAIVLGAVVTGGAFLSLQGWNLTIIAFGDDTAISLGIRASRLRLAALAVTSLVVAGIVSFTGTIGFIGLVSSHLSRPLVGEDHRFLLPASALIGASLLVLADTLARTVLSPIILPVGVFTSFLGVPVLLYLILRRIR